MYAPEGWPPLLWFEPFFRASARQAPSDTGPPEEALDDPTEATVGVR
jgi:hypothetical protein